MEAFKILGALDPPGDVIKTRPVACLQYKAVMLMLHARTQIDLVLGPSRDVKSQDVMKEPK